MPNLYDEFVKTKSEAQSGAEKKGSLYDTFRAQKEVNNTPAPVTPVSPDITKSVDSIISSLPQPKEKSSLFQRYVDWGNKTGLAIGNLLYGGAIETAEDARKQIEERARIKKETGELPVLTVFDKAKDIAKNPTQLIPFLSGGAEIAKYTQLWASAERLKNNTATEDDILILQNYVEQASQDTTFSNKVLNVIAGLPAFAGELFATAGVFTAGKKVATTGAKAVLEKLITKEGKKLLENRMAQVLLKSTGSLAGATLQTIPAGATRIVAGTVERMTPELGLTVDEAGQVQGMFAKDSKDNLSLAVAKSLGDQWIETVSERSGGIFDELAKPAKDLALKIGFVRSFLKTNKVTGKAVEGLNKLLNRAGWNGLLQEMGEERLGEVGRGLLYELGLADQGYKLPTKEQLLVELVGFGIPQVGITGAKMVANKIDTRKTPQKFDEGKQQLKQDIKESVETNGQAEVAQQLQEQIGVSSEEAVNLIEEALNITPVTGITDQKPVSDKDILEEINNAARTVDETFQMKDEAKAETPKSVQDILGELSDSEEVQQEWQDNYAEAYGNLSTKLDELEKQFKAEKDKTVKAKLEAEATKIGDKMAKMENDFIAEQEKKAEQIAKDMDIEDAVIKTEQEVNKEIQEPSKGYKRYTVNVGGQEVIADYNPKWGAGNTMHIEWRSAGPNPISETGYRSDFIMGNAKELGITEENIQEKLQERAEALAKEESKNPRRKSQKEKVSEAVKGKAKTIKQIAEETKIKEPNVRRILGVGAKEGVFERVEKGVYRLKLNGKELAYIETGNAVDVLPKLAGDGFKADMVFLDIPYETPAVKGGNRGAKYEFISVEDFGKVLDSVKDIARDENTPVVHMYSQAKSGLKEMMRYNDVFIEKGFKPVGKGEYQKTYKDGKPVGFPTMKGFTITEPEGILVFTQSGKLDKDLKNLNFRLVRPSGYQTEKPAEMLKQMIEMTTEEGDVVLDPFAGSGVTGAEAIKSGRKAVLVEKKEEVVENVIKPRLGKALEESKRQEDQTMTIKAETLRELWNNGKTITIAGKDYTVHKMNYGDYFLEPVGWKGGERDGFAPGTLWLEKDDPQKDTYKFTSEAIDIINNQEDNIDNGKGTNNTRGDVRDGSDTTDRGVDDEESESDGGEDTEPSTSLPPRERRKRSASTGERFGTRQRRIAELEQELRDVYIGAGKSEIDGFLKIDEALSNILTALDLAEPGQRIFNDNGVIGVPSTFPKWIPDNARHKKDLAYLLNAFNDVASISYPSKTTETKKRKLVDAMLYEIDNMLKVDTSEIRKKILNLYENKTEETSETQEVDLADLARVFESTDEEKQVELEAEAEEKREALGTSPEEIEAIAKSKTEIKDGVVSVTGSISEEELTAINAYTGSGGQESEGAEGRGLLDEYYTPGDVTAMTGAILSKLGAFHPNMTVLEPSAGIGAFLGDIPDEVAVDAHEINETAARILKLNYPNATVKVLPFEDTFITDRGVKKTATTQYDLVIGNPPYGEHRGKYKGLGEEPTIGRYEEYFIKRALDVTKEGGYVAMVIPSGFLRSGFSKTKVSIAQRGDLVTAYRLPNGAFANTEIGTDIVIIKKHDYLSDRTGAKPNAQILIDDSYFKDNITHVLGKMTEKKGKFGLEPVVLNTLEQATDHFYDILNVEYAEEQSTDDEVVDGIEKELADAYKPEVYKEIRKAEPIKDTPVLGTKKDTNETATVKGNKTGKLLDLTKYTTADEKEAEMWKYIQPTGELKGDFDKKSAFFYKGEYYNKFNYLQGDIYEKLDQLEIEKNKLTAEQYKNQKEALEAILPERMTVERMSVTPNSRFAQTLELTMPAKTKGGQEEEIMTEPLSEHFDLWLSTLPRTAFGDSSLYAIRGYIRNQAVRGGDKVQNEAERRTRRLEGDRLFKLFLKENLTKEAKKIVEDQYNRQFNSYVRPDYRQVPLVGKLNATFKGKPLDIKDVQLQGVGFLVNRGVGLLAHDVGVGKTMQSIIAINEVLARGWAKRPLIVTPSPNVYSQWIKEIQELLPDAKINLLANLGGDYKGDISKLEIPEGSISVITEEGFKRLGFSNETYDELTQDFFDVIEDPNESTKRASELAKSKAEGEVAKGIKGTRADIFFETLGFDHITVDEVHNANHIVARAKTEEGKVSEFRGFQVKPSQFGIKTWLAAQYIQKKNKGRNVNLASATPFTNNPLEYYSVLSLMARERMKRMGILNVNDFMTMFMEISTQHEFKADGSFLEKSEVRSFKNYQQFQKLLTEFIDFRDGIEAGVKRPDRVSKEYVVGETEDSVKFKDQAQALFADKEHAGALKAIGELRAIAFSPFLSRYYTGPVPSTSDFINKSPKLKALVEVIKQSLKDKPEAGHLIYSPVGVEYFPLLKKGIIEATGLKEGEVEIISGSTPKPRRSSIQEAFNKGTVKIVIGSDAIKEGVNLQENTTDLHILSLPWNFTEVRQVIGRAWRQGNKWPRVRVNTYFTQNSVDTFMSQKLQNKEKRYEEALKYRGDTLDVGDIDFEEMKMDLITDPVRRTELEYQFKENEIKHEIKRKTADQGYKNRRAVELVEAMQKVRQYEETVREGGDWATDSLARAKTHLNEVRLRLKSRGFDIDAMDKELEVAEKEVKVLEDSLKKIETEKEKAIEKAKGERGAFVTLQNTDYDLFVKERAEENKTFYDQPEDKFMISSVGGKRKLNEWQFAMDKELTKEEREAIPMAELLISHGETVPEDIMKLVRSAYKKFLDFNDSIKAMKADLEKKAKRSGLPFDLTEATGKMIMSELFDQKELSFVFNNGFITPSNKSENVKVWGFYQPSRAWRNPLIKVVSNDGKIQSKVLYHEAFHAYLDLFVPKEEKDEVLGRVQKNIFTLPSMLLKLPNYKMSQLAEEWLADDFANYASGKEFMKENESFYKKLLELIRTWIRKVTGAQRIYDAILAKERPEDYFKPVMGRLDMSQFWKVAGKMNVPESVYKGEKTLTTKILKDLEGRTTVSKQYIFDATNRPELKQVEKDITRAVLDTIEGDTVSVKEFAEKMRAELLPLKRVKTIKPDEDFMGQAGRYEQIALPDELRGPVYEYSENIYTSPIDTSAGSIHFAGARGSKKYFGHTRTEDMADGFTDDGQPNNDSTTRRVIEVQSDLYQKGNLERESMFGGEISKKEATQAIRDGKKVYAIKQDLGGEMQLDRQIKSVDDFSASDDGYAMEFQGRIKELSKLQQYNDPTAHFRMVREEIRQGALDGKQKLQFPTGETAMKIEGLGVADYFYNIKGNEIGSSLSVNDLKVGKEVQGAGNTWIITDVLGDGKFKAVTKSSYDEAKKTFSANTAINFNRFAETFDISGKVDTNNPIYRFYEKDLGRYLKNRHGATLITDKQGVSWYEVDISEEENAEATEAYKIASSGFFGFFRREKDESTSSAMEEIAESPVFEDGNRDLIRKDINTLESVTAQARDIYLKDPNEFQAAQDFERIADDRRVKKASLDRYFSTTMKPYFTDLAKNEQEKVNKVLMDGDLEAKEYTDTELKSKNLNEKQITAYKAVRKAFNVAHQYLIAEMRKSGVPEDEIKEFEKERTGYMPHKWKYRYAVKHQVRTKEGPWYTYQMDNFKTERQAREAFEDLKKRNTRGDVRYTLDTLDSLEVDFFSEQKLSFEAMKSVITQAKTSEDVKTSMVEALRNMIKEKGFGRQYMRRTGTRGYEQKEVPKIIADYFAGMDGYITKMEAGKQYYNVLSSIDARRQNKFYAWMRDMISYDMGNTKEWQKLRTFAFTWYLANDISFLLTNATQNFIVGTGELSKYMTGAEKILGPEARITKAMTDWIFGNVSESEKKVINSLIELGELGGEMVSELMGFKNNPLYSEISWRINKIMFASTAVVERNVNRVPAFLAARRLFLEQGMSEKEANRKALDVSNDIHFRYGKQNRPQFERGKVGVLFVFYHYMRSFMYQLYRDASKGEYTALARKLLYTTVLGGTASLPFAQSLIAIYREIFGTTCKAGDEDDCEFAKELSKWELAITHGLPSLTGVDLSGRVGIDIVSVSSIMEDPNDVRSYLGAVGNLIWLNPDADKSGRIQQGLELLRQGRIDDALGKLSPDMFGNLAKAYAGYNWGVRSFAGTPLEDVNGDTFKYNSWEAIIKATGFTPTRENLAWDAKSKKFVADEEVQAERSRIRRTIQGMVQRGNLDEAREAQKQAIEEGSISEETNYIKEFGKDTFIKDALSEWGNVPHTGENLRKIERGLIETMYGDKASDIQKLNVRKDFAILRQFGDDKLVEKIQGAKKNEDAAEILLKAREEIGEEAFVEFVKKGRKTVKTEKGNESYILISDDLLEAYKKLRKKLKKSE